MNEMQAQPAQIHMVLHITRAATGLTETVELTCTPTSVEFKDEEQNEKNGSHLAPEYRKMV